MGQSAAKNAENILNGNLFGLNLGMPFTNLDNNTFQALFNYASIGILIANSQGVIQMANKCVMN